ncbi:MAG TPA: hypothetical protein VMT22_15235, partial [Terriglobales bacterium]|nr:hypothetical protein [Terriglobales bacterium]
RAGRRRYLSLRLLGDCKKDFPDISVVAVSDPDDPPSSRRIDIPKDDAPPGHRLAPEGIYFDMVKLEYADWEPIADLAKVIMAQVKAKS